MFDKQDRLDDKVDKITSIMSKLAAQGSSQNRLFKPKIYQGNRRGQARNYYAQDRYQDRYRSKSGDRRMSYRGRAQFRQNYRGRSQYDQNYRGDFRKGNFRGMENYRGQNFKGGYRGLFRNDNFERGRSRSREREKDSIQVTLGGMIDIEVDQDQARINRDRFSCFKCREYDHFAEDCPYISETEKEQSEQIQQILNLEADKTALMVLMAVIYEGLIKANSEETIDHLN